MPEVKLPPSALKSKPRAHAPRTTGALGDGGAPFTIQCPPTIVAGAKITFCGESPGRNEVLERQGFTGGSGNILWRMCGQAGIRSDEVNRTNVAKRRPSSDDFGAFYHDPARRTLPTEELIFWQALLAKELEKHRPNVLVAVGEEALKAATGLSGISKYRGSILQSTVVKGLKVIPILHPAWIMRMNWEYYYIGIRDLKRVAEEAAKPEQCVRETDAEFKIRPTLSDAMGFMHYTYCNPEHEWNIDVETRGDTITCFALSVESRPDKAICVPIQTTTGPYWSVEEEVAIWLSLARVFNRNPRCMNQNLLYDLDYFLDPYRIEPSGLSFDPMSAMKFLYPEFDKGLAFTTSLYTRIPYYKDDGKTWKKKVPDEKVWAYNCTDVWATPKVAKGIRKDLTEAGLMDTYQKRVQRLIPIALEMQRNRLKVNTEWREKIAGILAEERIAVHKQLTELIGQEINVKSKDQVAHLLYDELKLPTKWKRGTDKVTTQENAIKELHASFPDIKALKLILAERHLRTRESNYINVTLDEDGHWPFMISVNNDKTGRWESYKSPKWRGTKITHIPKVMRLMIEPPVGRIFVQRDLSQGEVRYVAREAGSLFLNNIFASGKSVHKQVGARLFGIEPQKDTPDYDTAKSIVHAYNYMMGPKRMALEANVSFKFAEGVYRDYGREVPEISRWHQRIKNEALSTGRLTTPTGRVRQCFAACAMVTNTGSLADEIWRDLVSWKPQSTIPDIINEGMFRTWEALDWVRFHQQGHDSHLDSIEPERLGEFAERTSAFHAVSVLIDGEHELLIPSELSWGYLWGALKPWEPGDRGMREEWLKWAEESGAFRVEGKHGIKERLYSMF
jgi:uracil-DNA glycosylase family 4